VALLDLLHLAVVIELHELDGVAVVEAGDGGIIEGDVAVFADAHAAQVDRLSGEEIGVALALVKWQQAVALKEVEGLGAKERFDALLHVEAEASRMGGRDAEVLVHVEEGDLGPVDPAHLDELLEEADLGIAGGEDGGGAALTGDGTGEGIEEDGAKEQGRFSKGRSFL